jgi:hypothetical protein
LNPLLYTTLHSGQYALVTDSSVFSTWYDNRCCILTESGGTYSNFVTTTVEVYMYIMAIAVIKREMKIAYV